ncbi:hypothetical protein C349_05366 [Cryptococcus neoformans var. grubii Br795]|nr:hypothetical protein C353_05329 [Cryptococcus neoformans var. grubii AD1-83a]OXG51862.1 hypothetical protein C354_05271 [Cryptococcus neoformans var. grubii MW-RSA1955]OXG55812.1 hypothetical protein C352_05253 [Cryptococcus neoformans var. grubii CHC193]OXG59489.1 hypothetical protein C351_05258 [Cryptococcus neoformans var. grubii c8]OXG76888.1 hypothetical protein C349_05366 [Cryptococcus neoformans var. grubii Br795]OXH04884.1 hypothetical protein C369_05459 [Cryptococcus neoformans var
MQAKHQTFFPRNPSELNPNRLSLSKDLPLGTFQRGTVSMPASPLLGTQSMGNIGNIGATWDAPHSAQEIFEFAGALKESLSPLFTKQNTFFDTNSSSQTPQSWLPLSNSTNLDGFHRQLPQGPSSFLGPGTPMMPIMATTATNSSFDFYPKDMTLSASLELDEDMRGMKDSEEDDELRKETVDNGRQRKKKRAQVRVACTHCQKACKKCSNTRPCERCTKYGLPDCVDSTRKPRKTGIKRGPYKRRASKYTTNTGSDTSDAYLSPTHCQPQPQFKFNPLQPFQRNYFQQPNMHHPVCKESGIPSYPPGPRLNSISTEESSSSPGSLLTQALSAALTGPCWVDGQRVSLSDPSSGTLEDVGGNGEPKTSPMYPRTPVGAFPMALGIAGDPFSRAVSPIRQCGIVGSKGENGGHERPMGENGGKKRGLIDVDLPQIPSHGLPSLSITTTTPFLPNTDTSTTMNGHQNRQRYNSNPVYTPSTLHSPGPLSFQTQLQPQAHAHTQPGTMSPMCIPSKVRKPGLWTLIAADSRNGSLTPSSPPLDPSQPQAQSQLQVFDIPETGVGGGLTNGNGNDSPTLFNQPMEMDQDFEPWGRWGSATVRKDKGGNERKFPPGTSRGSRIWSNSTSYKDARQEGTVLSGEIHSHTSGRTQDGVEADRCGAGESVEGVGLNDGMSVGYGMPFEGLMGFDFK